MMKKTRFTALLLAALVLVSVPALSQPSFTARYGSDQAGAGWTPFAPKFSKRTVAASGDGSLADVIDSVVFDLDATQAASYSGSGTTWANLVSAPADGAAQTAYDFYTGDGATSTTYPTFNGSAGSSAAYWSFDGGDYFGIKSGANTAFLNALHKTTGGADWWASFTLQVPTDNTSDGFFTTQTNSASVGLRGLGGGTEAVNHVQYGFTAQTVATTTGTYATATPVIIIISHSHSNNQTRVWISSATAQSLSHTYNTTTNNASSPMSIGRAFTSGGDFKLVSNSRMYSFAMGNEYLDDAKAAAIITALEARHGRDYTP